MPEQPMRRVIRHVVRVAMWASILISVATAGWAQEPPTPRREAKCGEPNAVAELSGKVAFAEGVKRSAEIAVFNGHEVLVTTTTQDGSYCVPLTRSTAGTVVAVFASAEKAVPLVQGDLRVSAKATAGKPARIEVPAFNLQPSPNPDLGYVIGVAYVRVTGGRPVAQEGISHYDPGLKFTVEPTGADVRSASQQRTEHVTDKGGVFVLALAPGSYRLLTARNVLVDQLTIRAGGTTIQPLFSGEQIVF